MRHFVLPLALIAAVAACASTPDTGEQGTRTDELTGEQLAETGAVNAWDAVGRLQPDWLASDDRTGAFRPVVYYDGQRVGQVEYLRSVMVSSVGRIRYVNGYEAERRLGKDHSGGVLYIYSSRG
jgi:hypothetical protein